MWAPHQTPVPIKKIKTRWTTENTAQTQAVAKRLSLAREHLQACGFRNSEVMYAIEAALERLHDLDPQIVIPFL